MVTKGSNYNKLVVEKWTSHQSSMKFHLYMRMGCDPISIFHGGGGAFAFYRLYKNPIVFLLKDLPFSDPWHWERWVFLFAFYT